MSQLVHTCSKCTGAFEITCVGPADTVGSPAFCPRCGTPFGLDNNAPPTRTQQEVWEAFATRHDLPSVEFAQEVFAMWDPQNPLTPTFTAHLQNLMEEE